MICDELYLYLCIFVVAVFVFMIFYGGEAGGAVETLDSDASSQRDSKLLMLQVVLLYTQVVHTSCTTVHI